MPIRVKQILFDGPLDLAGFDLTGFKKATFDASPNGTNPGATELIYADGTHKLQKLEVQDKLVVGTGNTDFFVQKAIEVALNTRNLVYAYDVNDRVVTATERDDVNPVKVTTFTYDGDNRIATAVTVTTEGTLTSTYTYVGTTIDIATVTGGTDGLTNVLVGLLNFRQNSSLFGGGGPSTTEFAALQSAVAQLDLMVPRFKIHPVQTATAGQTIFTLPEPYVMGQNRLLVFSGGVLVMGDWAETSTTSITFAVGRELDEKIQVIEVQLGSDDGSTVVDTLPSTAFLAGEIPSGTIDSTDGSNGNGVFTVAHPVDPSVTPRLFIGGGVELLAIAWTRIGQQFTIVAPYKPTVGEVLAIYYKRVP